MKKNTLIAGLTCFGVFSLAVAANAQIYLTGSPVARAVIYAAATTPGQIFDSGYTGYPKVVSPSPYNTPNANNIVFEGYIGGSLVDLDFSYTSSDAGLAAVAQQEIDQLVYGQDINGNPFSGTYPVPGVFVLDRSPLFLSRSSGWTTFDVARRGSSIVPPDFTLADTSQASSLSPASVYPLTDFGVLGIVPFTCMKGYEKTPDQAWQNVKNVSLTQLNQLLAGPQNANLFTGLAADSGDFIVACGGNLASGARAITKLNVLFPLLASVDQWGYDAYYTSQGALTFGGNYSANQTLQDVGNDGFADSDVAGEMNVDGTGQGFILLGYLGIQDAQNAMHTSQAVQQSGGGNGVVLPFNGVYESDNAVIYGNYPYWGQEHLFGPAGSYSTLESRAIISGIAAQLTSSGAGTASGNISTSPQSALIPTSVMQVTRTADNGYPTQGNEWNLIK